MEHLRVEFSSTVPISCKFTNGCKLLAWHAKSTTHKHCTQGCARHMSSELLTRESKLTSVEHMNTCTYMRSWVQTHECWTREYMLACTRKYSPSNSQVVTIELASTSNHLVGNGCLWWVCHVHVIETSFPGQVMSTSQISTTCSGSPSFLALVSCTSSSNWVVTC